MTTAAEMAITLFRIAEVPLDPGLSEEQLGAFEAEYGFVFDMDHRELLMLAVLTGQGWFDWRRSSREQTQARHRRSDTTLNRIGLSNSGHRWLSWTRDFASCVHAPEQHQEWF
ncbi:hypothetical protein KPL76_12820 [Subtercola sp. PAMC28395]|uniref:hypothetical protein n=1 Tax=Subtercola sp. PAMC28395 TaxID=2846775 RepID=UPI001C0C01F2|nr:hypothetical protein [Subtercola sp. PAMC28395]QWT23573.1 hypothetical protein KPL76_12820 [Subtercola sp. PAMC28395]